MTVNAERLIKTREGSGVSEMKCSLISNKKRAEKKDDEEEDDAVTDTISVINGIHFSFLFLFVTFSFLRTLFEHSDRLTVKIHRSDQVRAFT